MARARLQELGDAEVDHTWRWRLNPHHGAVMEPQEYVDSTRVGTTQSPLWCMQLLSLVTARLRWRSLIPGTDLRPADVLTSALGNSYTALDISITLSRLVLIARRPDMRPNSPTMALPPAPEHLLHPDRVECRWTTSSRHVDCFALSQ